MKLCWTVYNFNCNCYLEYFSSKNSSVMSIMFHYFPCQTCSSNKENERGKEVSERVTIKRNSTFKYAIHGFGRMQESQCHVYKILMMYESLQLNELCTRWIWEKISILMCRKFSQRDLFSSKFKNASLDFSKMSGSYAKVTRSPKWEK